MSLYAPPIDITAEIYTSMPEHFRLRDTDSDWVNSNKPGQSIDCFLEGPAFDREGNLYVADIPYGRIFRIDSDGVWELVIKYDGWPNGMKFHRNGTLYIADYKRGLLTLDLTTCELRTVLGHARSEGFKGINDLFFDQRGCIYFTDQGQTGLHDPSGRVYRYDPATQQLIRLIDNGVSPNGLVMDCEEKSLFVAMTRGNAVWRLPILPDGTTSKVGIFTQLAGGVSGADGLALDSQGRLFVCDAGNGCVWVFSSHGEPLLRIRTPTAGRTLTNLAFGGTDLRTLYMTESATGTILRLQMDHPGHPLYSHSA